MESWLFDSVILSWMGSRDEVTLGVEADRQALIVHAVYKSWMIQTSMQDVGKYKSHAPRDRVHKSDGKTESNL